MSIVDSVSPQMQARLADEAIEVLTPDRPAMSCLLIAEHAGHIVPAPWRDLGLAGAFFDTHFAVDLGIADLTRRLSASLHVPAVLGRYSRLFLDFNRPKSAWDYMRPDLGGIPVPANEAPSADDRDLRDRIGWEPLEKAILDGAKSMIALISIHSFTPVMQGQRRDVDIGVLWKSRTPFVAAIMSELTDRAPNAGFRIGENVPYDWRESVGYTLDRHGEAEGRPCFYLEVRNTLLTDPASLDRVVALLTGVLDAVSPMLQIADLSRP